MKRPRVTSENASTHQAHADAWMLRNGVFLPFLGLWGTSPDSWSVFSSWNESGTSVPHSKGDLPFLRFTGLLFPVFLVQALVLLAVGLWRFPGRRLRLRPEPPRGSEDYRLFWGALLLLGFFVASVEVHRVPLALPLVLGLFAVAAPRVLQRTDWPLLILFLVMFVDFHLLARLSWVQAVVHRVPLDRPIPVFLFSLGASQVMSNVPAAIFTAQYTPLWLPLAYGVNLGGNGLVIASLANLIALRLAGDRRLGWTFHRYSLPFLLITTLLTLGLLRAMPV